jgi:hypothetical protein
VAIDAQFAEAWLNVEHKVFGLKLRPFSLWHKFLLEVTESPLVTKSDAKATDLYAACKLLTLKFPDNDVALTRFDWVRMFFRVRKNSAEIEGGKLSSYINDYFTSPEYWESEGKSGSSNKGQPPEQLSAIIPLLMMGFSEAEAWNMPIGKALWYGATYASWQGADLDFITAEEQEMRANSDELIAQLEEASAAFVPTTTHDPMRIKPHG